MYLRAVTSSGSTIDFSELAVLVKGALHTDRTTRLLYATDASVYRIMPAAVLVPADKADLVHAVRFAGKYKLPVTARTAGTSLSGQAVGEGLIIDFSGGFDRILDIDPAERTVRVEPAVIRDDLNRALLPHGLFFGPNTSTTNRCMIGGMLGNNSSGTTSVRYGVTRDKIIEVEAVLADGSCAVFGDLTPEELEKKAAADTAEGRIYRGLREMLSSAFVRDEIVQGYPKASIHRRNTGYALDVIADAAPFKSGGPPLNLGKLIAGSEGTLCLVTSVKLRVDLLPPPFEAVICAHFPDVNAAMHAAALVMKQQPYACELMDKTILDCTKGNPEQAENRFFVEGDPGAVLAVEVRGKSEAERDAATNACMAALREAALGYAYPVVLPPDTARVWALRAAGLGVLSNVPGDAKPVAFVEDTAVDINDLPTYIADFEKLMALFGQKAVYYAHAGAGELHLRPVLNLKSPEGRRDFRAVAVASAKLVAAYRGSLSGEHGDGRARSEFIAEVIGKENAERLKTVKTLWDPQGILNPGIITDPVPADRDFRAVTPTAQTETFLDFSERGGLLAAAEMCNGSGDCRKPGPAGGTMCPSYRATREEKDTTRARANMLREVLTAPENPAYPFGSEGLHEVLDLCLSCKACARECPSSVDMAKMKAEADYQYQRRHGFSLRTRFFGAFQRTAPIAARFSGFSNRMSEGMIGRAFKRSLGIAALRTLPRFSPVTGLKAARKAMTSKPPEFILLIDEFTMYQDAHVAGAAAEFFSRCGIGFKPVYLPSARPCMSKGMLPEARRTAQASYAALKKYTDAGVPAVGIEPSAVIGFRDDLPSLFSGEQKAMAERVGEHCFTFEEYVARIADEGRVTAADFTDKAAEVHLHLHCHQKARSHVKHSKRVLMLPRNYEVKVIPSGCCGMAGSFGYEEEHYDLSMKIGEEVLFPRVRSARRGAIIAAAGTSCRHQISDGTGRSSQHPAEVLCGALK